MSVSVSSGDMGVGDYDVMFFFLLLLATVLQGR